MTEEIFAKETAMCRELSQKNGGKCNWGECAKCGVIPLLYKFGKGKIYEKVDEVEELKKSVLE